MIFFLSGENSYDEHVALENVRSFFLKKTKDTATVSTFDATECTFENIEEALLTDTLFGAPQFVVVRGFIEQYKSSGLDWLIRHQEGLKESRNLFMFIERTLSDDMGEKVIDFFEHHADKTRSADFLKGPRLDRWLQEEAHHRGVPLSSFERATLIEASEGSQWSLVQELERRSLGGDATTFHKSTSEEKAVFGVVDMIIKSRCAHPMHVMVEMQKAGIEADKIIFTFLWKLKTILLAHRDATKKLNPYVAQKAKDDARVVPVDAAASLFYKGIRAESLMRRSGGRAGEIFFALLFDAQKILGASTRK